MTIYYIGYGYSYVEIIKMFNESGEEVEKSSKDNFIVTKSNEYVFKIACFGLICTSFVLILLHFIWKEDIKKYFARVMFKDDLRREISLKTIAKDYPMKFIRLSSSFFQRDVGNEDDISQDVRNPDLEQDKSDVKIVNPSNLPEEKSGDEQNCIICYTNAPNIIAEPCGHGGVCDKCMLE